MLLEQAALPDTPTNRAALRLLLDYRVFVPLLDDPDAFVAGDLRPIDELLVEGGGQVLVSMRGDPAAASLSLAQHLKQPIYTIALEPLTSAQISDLVAGVRPDARERIAWIAGARDVAEFLGVPLLLGMTLQVVDDLDPTVEVTRADLLDLCIDSWLRRADQGAVNFVEELALTLWRTDVNSCRLDHLHGPVPTDVPVLATDAASVHFVHGAFADLFLARALLRRLPQQPRDLLANPPPPIFELLAHQIRRQTPEPTDHPFISALTEPPRTLRSTEPHSASTRATPRCTSTGSVASSTAPASGSRAASTSPTHPSRRTTSAASGSRA